MMQYGVFKGGGVPGGGVPKRTQGVLGSLKLPSPLGHRFLKDSKSVGMGLQRATMS